MQTFLPYASFRRSARVLDRARLGKQRLEVRQLLRALVGETAGYRNHPACRMWEDDLPALFSYGIAICDEWTRRGYTDNVAADLRAMIDVPHHTLGELRDQDMLPWWFGSSTFHRSHRSNLLRKAPEHYDPFFGQDCDDSLPYAWPQGEVGHFRFKHAGFPYLN